MLPGKQPAAPESKPSHLLVGQTLPENLTVLNAEGARLPVRSLKTPTQAMVLGFYSPRCVANQTAWDRLRRLHEMYAGWGVAFIAVSVNSDETLTELDQALQAADLPFTPVRDQGQDVARRLQITATPQIVILDEWSQIRYRGPVDDAVTRPDAKPKTHYARDALDAVISHQEPVREPEPRAPIGCAIR